VWIGFGWFRIGSHGGLFKYGKEHLCSIKKEKYLDLLRDYPIVKNTQLHGMKMILVFIPQKHKYKNMCMYPLHSVQVRFNRMKLVGTYLMLYSC
jgi:hypothetical protein